jgi:hypothetical protein
LFEFFDFAFEVFESVAGRAGLAGEAVLGWLAGGGFFGELQAVVVAGDGADGRGIFVGVEASGDLGGDLETVKVETGLTAIDAAVSEGVEDIHDGDLDAAGVFKRGQEERLLAIGCAVGGVAAQAGVEVAKGPVAKGG